MNALLKSSIRNASYFFVCGLLAVVWYRANVLWCIALGLIFTFTYCIMLDHHEPAGHEPMSAVMRELDMTFQKWRDLGAPPAMQQNVDMINFFYALLPWRTIKRRAYDRVLFHADAAIESQEHKQRTLHITLCLEEFRRAYHQMRMYPEATKRLTAILGHLYDAAEIQLDGA